MKEQTGGTDYGYCSSHSPEDKAKLDELARGLSVAITGDENVEGHVCDDWPVCGRMTAEAFVAKWQGKFVNWDELPGDVAHCNVFGWRFYTDDDWDGLSLCVRIDKDGRFLSLIRACEPRNLFDPRMLEEHIALFDRMMREVEPPPPPPKVKPFEDGVDDINQHCR